MSEASKPPRLALIAGEASGDKLGAGLIAFCQAELTSGFELVDQLTNLEEQISRASFVFTAEGKIDSQTTFGKTISGVAKLAKKNQVPVSIIWKSVLPQ